MEYKLAGVNSKSFHNYTFDKPLGKINIFFGQNGSGKTALSKYIRELDQEHTQIFDSTYVEENIRRSNTVSGTTLIIGKDQIDKSDTIKQKHEEIGRLRDSKLKYDKSITETKLLFNNQMKKIIDDVKIDFNTQAVHQKPNSKNNPLSAYNLWLDEIDKYDDLKSNFASSNDLDTALITLNNRKDHLTTILPSFDSNREDKIIHSLATVVLKPESSVADEVVSWLEHGIKLHTFEGEEVPSEQLCLFCGNMFSTSVVRNNIRERISSEYAALIKESNIVLKELRDALTELDDIKEQSLSKQIESTRISINTLIDVIEKKNNATESIIKISKDNFQSIHLLNQNINELLKNINEEITETNRESTLIGNLAKRKIGIVLSKDLNIQQIITKLKGLEKDSKDQSDKLAECEKMLSDLQNESNELKGFMELVNKTLCSLGLCFKLKYSAQEKNGFDVVLQAHEDQLISISSLSEGEIRLLAFIQFYFSLFTEYITGDNEKETMHEFDITVHSIILDDPITSIDSNNRYFLTTLINQILMELRTQKINVFIFTHSLLDFHNFAFRLGDQITRYRILKDDNDHSYIEAIDPDQFRNYSDEYRSTFTEIVDFALKGRDKIRQSENYLQFGNKCRFLFETHARTNYNIENVTNASLDKIMEAYQISPFRRTDVSRSLDVISSLSHGISYTLDFQSETSAREVQSAARTILWILNNKDSQHVKAMNKNNWSQLKRQISEW